MSNWLRVWAAFYDDHGNGRQYTPDNFAQFLEGNPAVANHEINGIPKYTIPVMAKLASVISWFTGKKLRDGVANALAPVKYLESKDVDGFSPVDWGNAFFGHNRATELPLIKDHGCPRVTVSTVGQLSKAKGNVINLSKLWRE